MDKTAVQPDHPLADLLGRKLMGIEVVPAKEQTIMVRAAIRAAVKWANENKCAPECVYREKVTELQAELNLAKEMYPAKMKVVEDAIETVNELKSC